MSEKSILVVEDEVVVAEDIASTLRSLGYGVPAIANSGQEAITLATRLRPDLVLLDIKMPGKIDGIEAACTIHSNLGVPVVYVTAYSDGETLARAKLAQPYGYIIKPIQEEELRANIEFALFKHETERLGREDEIMPSKSETRANALKIMVVCDHPLTRHGITDVIEQQDKMFVCRAVENNAAVLQIASAIKPDILILDIALKGLATLTHIKDLRKYLPDLQILVLATNEESYFIERIFKAGANGYLTMRESSGKIVIAIRKIISGDIYINDDLKPALIKKLVHGNFDPNQPDVLDLLSEREMEVFQLLGTGSRPREIAKQLNLSVKTIETYRANIRKKLTISDAAMLTQWAIKWNNLHCY